MKIKKLLFVATIAIAGLTACDLESLSPTATVQTDLNTDIELKASTTKSAGLLADTYGFGGTGTIDLKENSDIKDQIDQLKEMTVDNASFTVAGLPDGKSILNIVFVAWVTFGDQSFDFTFVEVNDPISNGDVVTLSADQVTKLNSAFAKWEALGYENAVAEFVVAGSADFDIAGLTVPPSIKFKNAVSVKVGL